MSKSMRSRSASHVWHAISWFASWSSTPQAEHLLCTATCSTAFPMPLPQSQNTSPGLSGQSVRRFVTNAGRISLAQWDRCLPWVRLVGSWLTTWLSTTSHSALSHAFFSGAVQLTRAQSTVIDPEKSPLKQAVCCVEGRGCLGMLCGRRVA